MLPTMYLKVFINIISMIVLINNLRKIIKILDSNNFLTFCIHSEVHSERWTFYYIAEIKFLLISFQYVILTAVYVKIVEWRKVSKRINKWIGRVFLWSFELLPSIVIVFYHYSYFLKYLSFTEELSKIFLQNSFIGIF